MIKIHGKNQRVPLREALVFLVFLCLFGCRGVQVSHYYERGALATAAPITTDIGVQIFHEGGNAFDVAVAVGFALAVTHPEAGNIGGGGFALIRDGSTGQILALDFRETAPSTANQDMYLNPDGDVIDGLSTSGALACGVPGTVAGLYSLWERYGSLPWKHLVSIAAAIADTGFITDEYLAESFSEHRDQLSLFNETATIFFPAGVGFSPGDRFVQKDLAVTLNLIALEGKDGFYRGQVADTIVACMQQHGGIITKDDLETYHPIWREPVHFT
ncbi:MAG: gamma-glutamyltransferase, partial [Candidatus Zixiibacteriota bacterium]